MGSAYTCNKLLILLPLEGQGIVSLHFVVVSESTAGKVLLLFDSFIALKCLVKWTSVDPGCRSPQLHLVLLPFSVVLGVLPSWLIHLSSVQLRITS